MAKAASRGRDAAERLGAVGGAVVSGPGAQGVAVRVAETGRRSRDRLFSVRARRRGDASQASLEACREGRAPGNGDAAREWRRRRDARRRPGPFLCRRLRSGDGAPPPLRGAAGDERAANLREAHVGGAGRQAPGPTAPAPPKSQPWSSTTRASPASALKAERPPPSAHCLKLSTCRAVSPFTRPSNSR